VIERYTAKYNPSWDMQFYTTKLDNQYYAYMTSWPHDGVVFKEWPDRKKCFDSEIEAFEYLIHDMIHFVDGPGAAIEYLGKMQDVIE
jgi:hypothetical protein